MNETAGGQHPFAVVLSCMDSRTSVELIFDQGLGEIFSIRIAGNVVNDDILGSMEFAVAVKQVKLVVVLAHTNCGAIQGACDGVELENLTQLLKKVQPAIDRVKKDGSGSGSFTESVARQNVTVAIEEILQKSKTIREIYQRKGVGIAGGVYDVATGRVEFIQELFDGVVPKEMATAV